MLNIDQFESAFRAAARSQYHHKKLTVDRALVITDLGAEEAARYAQQVAPFLHTCGLSPTMVPVAAERSRDLGDLVALVKAEAPDLIVTYRCLHTGAWRWPYTVGDHVEVLTQITDIPVLLLPRAEDGVVLGAALSPPQVVMALTDHIVGDERLVRWAAGLTPPREWLVLAHVEDQIAFDRYMDLIGKVPSIDTDVATRELRERMFKEVRAWIRHCRDVLREVLGERAPRIEEATLLGHRLKTSCELVARREAQLLVLNTKDDDQIAIHGMAYPLMVELRRVPLLLL